MRSACGSLEHDCCNLLRAIECRAPVPSKTRKGGNFCRTSVDRRKVDGQMLLMPSLCITCNYSYGRVNVSLSHTHTHARIHTSLPPLSEGSLSLCWYPIPSTYSPPQYIFTELHLVATNTNAFTKSSNSDFVLLLLENTLGYFLRGKEPPPLPSSLPFDGNCQEESERY